MKKILEYRVYDILKDPENEKFLSKVKKENPDLYTKFLNLVGNKGLQKAKEMYIDYDPEVVKKREEEEKKEKALQKKLGREEYKRQKNQEMLDKFEKEINEINKVLYLSELRTLPNIILNDSLLGDFLTGIKKKYINVFKELLKKPKELYWRLGHDVTIDSVEFYLPSWEGKISKLITISQLYNLETKKSTYSIKFSFSAYPDDFWNPVLKSDRNKEMDFLENRNNYLEKLSKFNISKEELYDIIFKKFKAAVSNEVYLKWKEEYILRKDTEKYNL